MTTKVTSTHIRALAPDALPDIAGSIEGCGHLFDLFGVNTPLRVAHFLTQCCHETGGFRRLTEHMNYSAERLRQVWPNRFSEATARSYAHQPERIANYVYAGRMGNGPESSGDGWRYRGRGLLMATGREMYRRLGYEGEPDRLGSMPDALASALAIWRDVKGCNPLADADDLEAIRRRINGGTIGLEECRRLLAKAKAIFTVAPDRPTLREGDRGEAVAELQRRLGVEADGVYGRITAGAVRDFQMRHGLVPDGVASSATWSALLA